MHHNQRMTAAWLLGMVSLALTAAWTQPVQAERTQGEWIIVRTPLTSEAVTRLKNATNRAIDTRGAKKIVYQFQYAGASEYGPCHDFASFLVREIKGRAETYAYIDKPLLGHAVLPALACNYLWLGPDGAVGKVRLDSNTPIDEPAMKMYVEVAEARGKFPALILKMLYPELVVYQIDSVDGKKFKLDREQAARLEIDARYALAPEEVNQDPKPILPEQTPGLYRPRDEVTKNFGLWGRVYATPQQVVEALDLPGSIVQGNPLLNLEQPPRAAKIEIKKEITRGSVESIKRQIKRAVEKEKVNCIIFEMSAWGGPDSVEPADGLAKEILALKDKNVLTVAFVPTSAKGAATFVAFSCNRIVMGPTAELGDCRMLLFDRNNRPLPEREVLVYRDSLRSLADKQGYPPVLVESLLNPSLEIVKVQAKPDPNRREQTVTAFMEKSRVEMDNDRWNIVETVKPKDKPLVFETNKAIQWGIAWDKVDPPDSDTVAKLEGIEGKVKVIGGGWLDQLAQFLAHPVTTVFLVIVFFTCIILEFKAPGIGVPAVIAAISIVLVFWANSWLSEEINSLAILLFLLGLVLLGVELFILPGFGVCGISGILLILLGISLVVVQRWPETPEEYLDLGKNLSIFAAGLLVSLFAAFILARYLPNVPYANRLILQPPDEATSDAGAPLPPAQSPALLGAIGVAVTTLRPAGKARFGDEFVDVAAEGTFVEPGARVQVIEIDGVRVVVKPV
jgi:membrane-bound serine protease (ClpP class)